MFSNFLEAKRYFQRMKYGEFLTIIDHFDHDADPHNCNFGMGFIAPSVDDVWESTTDTRFKYIIDSLKIAGYSSFFDVEEDLISRSADKFVSPRLAYMIAYNLGKDSDYERFDPCKPFGHPSFVYADLIDTFADIAKEVNRQFGKSLLKIAQTYFESEYTPINNYDMKQVETPDIIHTKSGGDTRTETSTNTKAGATREDGTETPDVTITDHIEKNTKLVTDSDSKGSVYGFNSATAVPMNEGEAGQTTEGSKDDNYQDSTHTEEGSTKNVKDVSVSEAETGSVTTAGSNNETDSETGTRTLERAGNIGVMSTQDLINQELELRRFDFIEAMLKCFDRIIVRSVY